MVALEDAFPSMTGSGTVAGDCPQAKENPATPLMASDAPTEGPSLQTELAIPPDHPGAPNGL